ncbi:7598_t:CDS:2 [Paraglomus occultum]|uniref:Ribosomal RNA-processing protein 41 n=1 Tax=Paraglomus occultum TaxID=144539 RepID=A0A9N8WFD7_9GLOM|nr:7598_t:CDS:2 [Paraglomus occultum]
MSRKELLNPAGLRVDGRRATDIRRISCKPSVLSQADGSAYIEQGNTKCLAAVYGPREPRQKSAILHNRANISVGVSFAPFATSERKKWSKSDKRLLEIASFVKQTFEPVIQTTSFPRSQIDIFLQILQFDGGTIQICINATTMALVDAGIPMNDYVCACTAGVIQNVPILDLNLIEESSDSPEVTVAILADSEKVTLLQSESRLDVDSFQAVAQLAKIGCKEIRNVMDAALRKNIKDLFGKMEAKIKTDQSADFRLGLNLSRRLENFKAGPIIRSAVNGVRYTHIAILSGHQNLGGK